MNPINLNNFSCCLIGDESHLIQCADILLQRGHDIQGVISSEPRIENWTREKGLTYFEPGTDLLNKLRDLTFDYLFSITNFSIIPNALLDQPRKNAINFHDGPLPRYAGLNVTSWALINHEKTHGVTWHTMSSEVDKGDILKQYPVAIERGESAFTLNIKCYEAAIDSFAELVDELARDRVIISKQNLQNRTYFSKYKRPPAACTLTWSQSAAELDALIRALDFGPYPNPLGLPKMVLGNEIFIVPKIEKLETTNQAEPGTITAIEEDKIRIATASNEVVLTNLQAIDGQPISIAEFIGRFDFCVGDNLGELDQKSSESLTTLNKVLCRHESYWLKRLTGNKSVEIPNVNQPKAKDDHVQYNSKIMTVPSEVHAYLISEDSVCPAHFLVTAFAAYLGRNYENYNFDLGFGHPPIDEMIAAYKPFFSSHIPLRVNFDPSINFIEAFNEIQTQLEEIEEHKTFPTDIFLRYPELSAKLPRALQSPYSIIVEIVSNFDGYSPLQGSNLTFLISESGLECEWVYDNAKFNFEGINNFQSTFVTFLKNCLRDMNKPISEISLLTDLEYEQIILKWNNTLVDYPKDRCIHQFIELQVEQTPDAVAVIFEDQQLTYQQLNSRANQLAHHLQKFNVGPETCVGIYMERSLDMIVGLLGILKAGGAYLPLDHTYPAERIAYMVRDAQVPVLLTQAKFENDPLLEQAKAIYIDSDWSTIAAESEDNCSTDVTSDNLGYIIYTSGSTGKPKGVMVCHRNVANFFIAMDERIPFDSPGVWLAVTSLSFDISVLELFWTLARGFKLTIYSDSVQDNKKDNRSNLNDFSIPALILRHDVTHFQCTPSMVSMLLMDDEIRSALMNIETFLVGGEAFPVSMANKLKKLVSGNILNMYGPTETTIWSSTYSVSGEENTMSIGRPIANTDIYILDHNFQPVPIGIPGELFIGGEGVVRGYLNQPELTAERFLELPILDKTNVRIYRTGDLVRYRDDGNIEFLNRIDHQVKIRGHRIELGEIETLLNTHPTVRESVVVSREDIPGDKRLVAYLIADSDQNIASLELRSFLQQQLSDFMIPSHFIRLDSYPLTPNRKIDRKQLPPPDNIQIESGLTYVPPKNELEKSITKIWQDLLNVPKVGMDDNFFDLGGHSLIIIQALHLIRELISHEISITDLFRFPTIRSLTDYLSQDSIGGTPTSTDERADRAKVRREALRRKKERRKDNRES